MEWIVRGRVWKFGDNIAGDAGIIPFDAVPDFTSINPSELAKVCMTPIDPDFPKKVKKGDIMVVGKNFGVGKVHIQAPISILGTGISCVIAESVSRYFFRKSINYGLPLLICEGISRGVAEGDELEIHFETGRIRNLTSGSELHGDRFPEFIIAILKSGGFTNYLKSKINPPGMTKTSNPHRA